MQIRKATTSLRLLFCNFQKYCFYYSTFRQIRVDVFIKYNILLPGSAAVKRLFSMGAANLAAKRACLTSKNFQRLIFLKGNLDFLKRLAGCAGKL